MGLFSFLKDKFAKKTNESTILTYDKGLKKAKKAFVDKIDNLSNNDAIPSDYFSKLEEILLEADVGINLVVSILDKLATRINEEKIKSLKIANEALIDEMFKDYVKEENIVNDISFNETPTVLLVVGVNGVGKTTTIAKLANRYKSQGKSVMLAAADTFRAGAVDQLKEWAKRLDIEIVTGEANSDPASVAYKGAKLAKEKNVDLLIVDTAGRQQTKTNLMNELSKIGRVISKEIPNAPHETFLVLDATTGQNGVFQAKAFNEATKITGAVITKMDGTSKGGILLAIRHDLNIPVRFIGLGERMEDLEPFDINKYLHGLCIGE